MRIQLKGMDSQFHAAWIDSMLHDFAGVALTDELWEDAWAVWCGV